MPWKIWHFQSPQLRVHERSVPEFEDNSGHLDNSAPKQFVVKSIETEWRTLAENPEFKEFTITSNLHENYHPLRLTNIARAPAKFTKSFVAPTSVEQPAASTPLGTKIRLGRVFSEEEDDDEDEQEEEVVDEPLQTADRRPVAPPGTQFGSRISISTTKGTTKRVSTTTTRRSTTTTTTTSSTSTEEEEEESEEVQAPRASRPSLATAAPKVSTTGAAIKSEELETVEDSEEVEDEPKIELKQSLEKSEDKNFAELPKSVTSIKSEEVEESVDEPEDEKKRVLKEDKVPEHAKSVLKASDAEKPVQKVQEFPEKVLKALETLKKSTETLEESEESGMEPAEVLETDPMTIEELAEASHKESTTPVSTSTTPVILVPSTTPAAVRNATLHAVRILPKKPTTTAPLFIEQGEREHEKEKEQEKKSSKEQRMPSETVDVDPEQLKMDEEDGDMDEIKPLVNPVIVCALPPDAGHCKDYVPRWFFNAESGQCEQFSYGSCGGNANNFFDRATCEVGCIAMHRPMGVLNRIPERCAHEKEPGFGGGYNVLWYFNTKNLRCEQFIYQGSGGNPNRFVSITACQHQCSSEGPFAQTQPPTTQSTQRPTTQNPLDSTDAVTVPFVATQPPQPVPQPPKMSKEDMEKFDKEYSHEEMEKEDEDEDEEEADVSADHRALLEPIPDHVKSFEKIEDVDLVPPPSSPIVGGLQHETPGEVAHPPAVRGDKTLIALQPNQIPDNSNPQYKVEPLPVEGTPLGPNANQPIVGPSPPESVNYQTGAKPKAHGINSFSELNAIDIDKFDVPEGAEGSDDTVDGGQLVPACPNGLQAHRYVDGRPVQCLPGRNQCPVDSVCYFNGLDYFCCPTVEDPYDKHIFGGYDGEETKQGYKQFGPLKIRRLRDAPIRDKRSLRQKRQTAFSMDDIVMPLRFDAEKPRQFASAAAVMGTSQRRRKQPSKWSPLDRDVSICIQPVQVGDCHAQHSRYFYDRNTDTCQPFYYSGCKGNANNFLSLDDCQRLCVIGQRRPSAATVIEEEKPVPAGQCPGEQPPLGGKYPVLCGNKNDSFGCPTGYYCRGGPPDVCCPGQNPATVKFVPTVLGAKTDVRASVDASEEEEEVEDETVTEQPTTTTTAGKKAYLEVPEFICPDASDPLFGRNGRPLLCGAGFDGVKMCPRGFYCAIDAGRGTRLCCPLLGSASRIPNEQVDAPYFGRRQANPGEVVGRGSLPEDASSSAAASKEEEADYTVPEVTVQETRLASSASVPSRPSKPAPRQPEPVNEEGEADEDEYEDEGAEQGDFAKLKMKPDRPVNKAQQIANSPEVDGVHIEIESETDVVDAEAPSALLGSKEHPEHRDLSECQLAPSVGRICREDEPAPRTNLHYYYSPKDKRCKLYFYKGCGGNANRFEKKAQCEEACARV
ncbi:unnamed protein product, partial [Mesorhabditis spiculigera]